MKALNEKQIRILRTLEALERINHMIVTLRSGEEPNEFLANDYEIFKKQLVDELFILLAQYDISIPNSVVTA